MKTSLSFSNRRSTLEVINLPELGLMPVKWKLAKLDLDMGFPSIARANVGSEMHLNGIILWNSVFVLFFSQNYIMIVNILRPNVSPSNVGNSDWLITCALRGRVNGITECGKVFG